MTANLFKQAAQEAEIPEDAVSIVCFDGVEYHEQKGDVSHILPSEYIYTGGIDLAKLKHYRELNPYLDDLVPSGFNLQGFAWVGASQNRVKGAVMFGFRKEIIIDRIRKTLFNLRNRTSINKLLKEHDVPSKSKPAIHIVCSAAGGSGSSCLTQLVQELSDCSDQIYLHILRASPFLALADSHMTRDRLKANEVATLLEVDEYRDKFRMTFVYDAAQSDPDSSVSGTEERDFLVKMIARKILLRTSTELSKTIESEDNFAQELITENLGKQKNGKYNFGINRLFISSSALGELYLNTDHLLSKVAKRLGRQWIQDCVGPDHSQPMSDDGLGDLLVEALKNGDDAMSILKDKLNAWLQTSPTFGPRARLLEELEARLEKEIAARSNTIEQLEDKEDKLDKMSEGSELGKLIALQKAGKVEKKVTESSDFLNRIKPLKTRVVQFRQRLETARDAFLAETNPAQRDEAPISLGSNGSMDVNPVTPNGIRLEINLADVHESFLQRVIDKAKERIRRHMESAWKMLDVAALGSHITMKGEKKQAIDIVEAFELVLNDEINQPKVAQQIDASATGYLLWLKSENSDLADKLLGQLHDLGKVPWLDTVPEAMGGRVLTQLHKNTTLCANRNGNSQDLDDLFKRTLVDNKAQTQDLTDHRSIILYHSIHGVPLRGLQGFAGDYLRCYHELLKRGPLHPLTWREIEDKEGNVQKFGIGQKWWMQSRPDPPETDEEKSDDYSQKELKEDQNAIDGHLPSANDTNRQTDASIAINESSAVNADLPPEALPQQEVGTSGGSSFPQSK